MGRELLTPDETRKLDNKKCILFVRGCDPIIDNKFNTFAHPLFKESEDGGALPYIHDITEGQKENKIKAVGKKSWNYYNKCKKKWRIRICCRCSARGLTGVRGKNTGKSIFRKGI